MEDQKGDNERSQSTPAGEKAGAAAPDADDLHEVAAEIAESYLDEPETSAEDGVTDILASCVSMASTPPPPGTETDERGPARSVPKMPTIPPVGRAGSPERGRLRPAPGVGVPSDPQSPASSVAPVAVSQRARAVTDEGPPRPASHPTVSEPAPRRRAPLALVALSAVLAVAALWLGIKAGAWYRQPAADSESPPGNSVARHSDESTPPPEVAERGSPEATAATAAVRPSAEPSARETSEPEPQDESGPFDPNEAADALKRAAVRASRCTRTSARKRVRVSVTFTPSGLPSRVYVLPGPFSGTPASWCMAKVFQSVRVSPFSGDEVTLIKGFDVSPSGAPAAPAQPDQPAPDPSPSEE